MQYEWWAGQPVLVINLAGDVKTREQAYAQAQSIVELIEGSSYPHILMILDMRALGHSPSAGALLAGNLPETMKIEHLIMIGAPFMFKMAIMPLIHLRHKFHFVSDMPAARDTARTLLPKLPT